MPLSASFAVPDRHMPILCNPKQPRPESRPAGIETMDPAGRDHEDLMGHLFGQVPSATRKRDAELVQGIEVPFKQLPPCLLAATLCGLYRKCF